MSCGSPMSRAPALNGNINNADAFARSVADSFKSSKFVSLIALSRECGDTCYAGSIARRKVIAGLSRLVVFSMLTGVCELAEAKSRNELGGAYLMGQGLKVYHIAGGIQPESYQYSNYFEAIDGDPEKIKISDASPDGGRLIMPGTMTAGRPILPEHVPSKLRRGGPGIEQQPLLDVNSWKAGTLLVPQVFKDILQDLEPDVHQFFPVKFFQGEANIGEGYLFIICKRLDTLHDSACWPGRDERGFLIAAPDRTQTKAVFSKEKIKGHHAWVDKFAGGPRISEEFARRLKAEELTGLVFNESSAE